MKLIKTNLHVRLTTYRFCNVWEINCCYFQLHHILY